MAYDANAVLDAIRTSTATFTGTGFDLKTMTPRRGLFARLRLPVVSSGTTQTLDVKIQDSADNTTFADLVNFSQLATASETAVPAPLFVKVETGKRYIRALGTLAGTAPSFVTVIDLGIARP